MDSNAGVAQWFIVKVEFRKKSDKKQSVCWDVSRKLNSLNLTQKGH
ncbi:hypothetical protein MIDIC_10071 [Alphaproteobacteria bacterium]